jgi:hypothetical protein
MKKAGAIPPFSFESPYFKPCVMRKQFTHPGLHFLVKPQFTFNQVTREFSCI